MDPTRPRGWTPWGKSLPTLLSMLCRSSHNSWSPSPINAVFRFTGDGVLLLARPGVLRSASKERERLGRLFATRVPIPALPRFFFVPAHGSTEILLKIFSGRPFFLLTHGLSPMRSIIPFASRGTYGNRGRHSTDTCTSGSSSSLGSADLAYNNRRH